MAVQLNDATAIINRTTNLVAASSNYCCCFWYRPTFTTIGPAYLTAWAVTDLTYAAYAGVYGDDDYYFGADNGGGGSFTAVQVLTTDRPVHVAYRRSGTSHFFYLYGQLIGSTTEDMSAVTFFEMLLGNDRFSNVDVPMQFWDFAEWSAAQSVTTIVAQMASYGVPAALTNLVTFTPLVSDLLDDSGNGNDWTGAGNYTFVANPSLPANVSSATATVIGSRPYTLTLSDVYNLPQWFLFTAGASENAVGVFAYGEATGYKPILDVFPSTDLSYSWPGGTAIGVNNKPAQFPVIPGDSYYIEYTPFTRGLLAAPFAFSLLTTPASAVPIGSFLINDDAPGFSAAILSNVDGSVLSFGNPSSPAGFDDPLFPAGEAGENLSRGNGRIVLIDDFVGATDPQIYIYEPTLEVVGVFSPPTYDVEDVTSDSGLTRFYLKFDPPATRPHFQEMSDAGVISSTVIGPVATAGVRGCVVSNDRTILYYTGFSFPTTATIRRWDINANIAMSDLAANPGGYAFANNDIIGCPDDGVIAAWLRAAPPDYLYIKYTAAGAIAWTLSLTAYLPKSSVIDRMSLDVDPAYFWIFFHAEGGVSHFFKVAISDGVIADTILDVVQYEGGVYEPDATASPLARFGHSFSCPFLVLTAGEEGCPGETGPSSDGLPYNPPDFDPCGGSGNASGSANTGA